MLAINPLLIILFENIFSYSVDFLFILSMISFALQKLLGLISSHLFILEIHPEKIVGVSCVKKIFCLCFLLGVL